MAKKKRRWWFTLGLVGFIFYIFIAAQPIPKETILTPRWITSLGSNFPAILGEPSRPENDGKKLLSFRLGDRFGYVGEDGTFAINQALDSYISLSENMWAAYDAQPASIRVMSPLDEPLMEIKNPRGYPLFLDNRIFIAGSELNSLTAFDSNGEELWIHDFSAPITCVDAAGGYVLAGTLDGSVVLLDSSGMPVFSPFEPGGSRLSVILGCAISRDASLLAIVSGIDNQRFLLMEHFGETYRVIYHEFLTDGFRRPVHISFIDNDRRIAFEREGGLSIYNINARTGISVNLEGEIDILDNSGGDDFLFVITSQGQNQKRFIAIRYPGAIAINAPFKSDSAFFTRRGERLFLGGDYTMASLALEKK